MPWVESHSVLVRHRKLIGLSRDLRLKPVHAMGHLHALWHVAIEQQEDGDFSSWDDAMIAAAAEFTGDAPQFVSLLRKHRWLDGGLLHDWLDYAGLYLTRKYASGNRKRLEDIWQKHGRAYGPPSKHNANTTQTQRKHNASATYLTNQPTNQPDAGARAAPLRREEIPPTLLTQAKSLIELYKSVVTAAHPAGLAVENLIANVLASHPTRTPGAWEHAVKTYGDDCRKNGRLAQSPRTFFEGTWSEFIDVKLPSMKPQEDIISELRERNARSAQAARGVQCPHNQT